MVPLVVIAERAPGVSPVGEWIIGCYAPGFAVSGWWLIRRRPDLLLGPIYLVAGLTAAIAGFSAGWAAAAVAQGWDGVDWGLWVFSWMWIPHLVLASYALLIFPDGAIESSRWRRLALFPLGFAAVAILARAVSPGSIVTTPDKPDGPLPGLVNPVGSWLAGDAVAAVAGAAFLMMVVSIFAAQFSVVVRWRRAEGLRRRQLRLAAATVVLGQLATVFIFALPQAIGPTFAVAETFLLQMLIAGAILRWRLYDVGVVVRRSVLAVALLVAALGVYGAMVVVVSNAIGGYGPVASSLAAMVAIFVFGPLSLVIRRGVDQLFYGRQGDPYAVLSSLTRRLSHAADPEAALTAIIEALLVELRLPYVGVLSSEDGVLVERGAPEPGDEPLQLVLTYQGEDVGELRVGHRWATTQVSPPERELLDDLARQVGSVVQAVSMRRNLIQARASLVISREEERRRLQRDLHDGLGPVLTGVTMKLDAAVNHLRCGTDQAEELIVKAREELGMATVDVRRIAYSLGDPALETIGLARSLQDHLGRLRHGSAIDFEMTVEHLPPLAAAVELAAYRVAVEAVANVVRHAGATRCTVRLSGTDALGVCVADNGQGLGTNWRVGVGVRSMRERVSELGGTIQIPGVLLVPPAGRDGSPYGRRPGRGLTRLRFDPQRV